MPFDPNNSSGGSSDEVRRLLYENLKLARENNELLRKLKRAQTIRSFFSLLYLIVIIGVPLYLYFTYVAPMMDDVRATYAQLQAGREDLQHGRIPEELQALYWQFMGGEEEEPVQ